MWFPDYTVPPQRRALDLLASWRDASNRAFERTRGFIIETLVKPTTQFFALFFGLPLFSYLVLALAQVGSGSSCHWQFPKWFGCVLDEHDGLAAGLVGASGALFAAWIAWTAVQRQINADHERATADRDDAEQRLSTELFEYSDGVAAALRYLSELQHSETAGNHPAQAVYEAVAYVAERISRTEQIANCRTMAETLNWDRRADYAFLLDGLDQLRQFKHPAAIQADAYEALQLLRRLANAYMSCLPNTSRFFEGLFLGSAKAYTLSDIVDRIVERGGRSRAGF
jgi:hypothetical protein